MRPLYQRSNGSSSSDSSFSLQESTTDSPILETSSETETFNCDSLIPTEEEVPTNDDIAIEKYVLVKFLGGKNAKYYAGKVIDIINNQYTVKYSRKNSNGSFSWLLVDDIFSINVLDIEKVLPKLQVGRRGELRFIKDLKICTSKIY